ncbi:hypothetical protein, partial [Pedobacter jejuensis]
SVFVKQNNNITKFTTTDSWVVLSQIERQIKSKIEAIGTPLKDWKININYGIKTGFNDAFIITEDKKMELIQKDCNSIEVIKPILRGRDIKRYGHEYSNLYIIFIPWHFPLHNDPKVTGSSDEAEEAFKITYPAVYNHLYSHKNNLEKRNKAETGIRYEWYALQRWGANYWEDFFSP